jgi:hypothetical protein
MITNQLEIIEQGQLYLDTVSNQDYTEVISPHFISSAGSHIRHIIDHYLAIMSGLKSELINYDTRKRGVQLESSPKLAKEKFDEIVIWIQNLCEDELNAMIMLSTEISVINKKVQKVQTSIARELIFAGNHAVHHYAMIAQISFAQKSALQTTNLPENFGLAAATATFLRENNELTSDAKNEKKTLAVIN